MHNCVLNPLQGNLMEDCHLVYPVRLIYKPPISKHAGPCQNFNTHCCVWKFWHGPACLDICACWNFVMNMRIYYTSLCTLTMLCFDFDRSRITFLQVSTANFQVDRISCFNLWTRRGWAANIRKTFADLPTSFFSLNTPTSHFLLHTH